LTCLAFFVIKVFTEVGVEWWDHNLDGCEWSI